MLGVNTAYDRQEIIFTCNVRSTSTILSWSSPEYIDDRLQLASVDSPGHTESNPSNPTTFATLISATTDDEGVVVIVSQLQIMASSQYPFSESAVTCHAGDMQNTVAFRKLNLTAIL